MDAKVRDVMTPGPIGVDYYQSIGEAARTMRDWGIGAVLVVNNQSLYGLVTDRDLVVRAVAEARGPDQPVGPLSTGDLIGVDVDSDAGEAARLMRENAVRRLPVIEDGQVTGVVSLGDLALQDDPASDASAFTSTPIRFPLLSGPTGSSGPFASATALTTRSRSVTRPYRDWSFTTRTAPTPQSRIVRAASPMDW